jgi:aspartyl-tRNA(Asn)/glutamyl-tRNA(Gln) amidotransferase subunit C
MAGTETGTPRISPEDVREIAHLARLRLSEDEIARMAGELDRILQYIEEVKAVDTAHIEPMTHAVPFDCPQRPDEVRPSLPADEALRNAPRRQGSFFEVPRIVAGVGGGGEM